MYDIRPSYDAYSNWLWDDMNRPTYCQCYECGKTYEKQCGYNLCFHAMSASDEDHNLCSMECFNKYLLEADYDLETKLDLAFRVQDEKPLYHY